MARVVMPDCPHHIIHRGGESFLPKKDRRITIRLYEHDLMGIQKKAEDDQDSADIQGLALLTSTIYKNAA